MQDVFALYHKTTQKTTGGKKKMALEVKYNENPVWRGRTGGKEYSLHRATLSSTVGWSVDGYLLIQGSMPHEFYYGSDTTPYQGLWSNFFDQTEAGTFPMPAPDPDDVVNFVLKFASLCERGGEPLQKGEFLL